MSQPDIKPTITVDGHDVFNIPVEEEELEVSASAGQSKVWAMKIPRFLLERWEQVRESGVHLGTLVVDNNKTPPVITLRLPSEDKTPPASDGERKRKRLDVSGIPDEYEVVLPSHTVKNTYVFTEHIRTWVSQPGEEHSAAKRKRQKARPRLLGALDHEGSVRPIHSAKYLKILEQRRLEAEQSKRPIVMLDDTVMSQAKLNQLASGFANASSTLGQGMVLGQSRVVPGERFARLERGELTDRLFACFNEKPYWSLSALKATLQQPEQWLREVLKDVATLNKEGPYANLYALNEHWKTGKGEGEEGGAKPDLGEDDDDDDIDDDDDEDMESDDDELELVEVS